MNNTLEFNLTETNLTNLEPEKETEPVPVDLTKYIVISIIFLLMIVAIGAWYVWDKRNKQKASKINPQSKEKQGTNLFTNRVGDFFEAVSVWA